ncbi:hypothetical protein P692DRAFT_20762273, partial [Suillus brevipes Sb2]
VQRESRIQEALAGVQGGRYKSYMTAAKAHQISVQTLHDRATGRHQSIQHAARKRQLLSPQQEEALLDWCCLNLSFTTPLHTRDLHTYALEICGRRPGKKLVRRFIRRHSDCLVVAKPRGLDPKRTQNFNRKAVGTISACVRRWTTSTIRSLPSITGTLMRKAIKWEEVTRAMAQSISSGSKIKSDIVCIAIT